MLREWFSYLTTPCPGHLRRLGHLQQTIGLQSRHRRCRKAWQSHLDNSRSFIAEAAEAGGVRALVVGSGLLLDVPLAALSEKFQEVVLVDLLHLPAARREAGAFGNLRLVECDVTGLCESVARLDRHTLPKTLPRVSPRVLHELAPDLVVSCNILSQLPLVPRDFLEEKLGFADQAELQAFCHDMLRNHLGWLAGFACRLCLICDHSRQVLKQGQVVDEEDALFGLRLPPPDAEWIWDIAPAPEIDRSYGLRHRVAGYRDFTGAAE